MSNRQKKLVIDITDTDSIDRGMAYLKEFERKEHEKIVKELPHLIASRARRAAMRAYQGYAYVWYSVDENGTITIGADDDEICFIEFGAGVYAESEKNDLSIYTKGLGFYVFPGSWSLFHKKTYQRWEAEGRPGEYQYNIQPLRGLHTAYNLILNDLEKLAKEVFL